MVTSSVGRRLIESRLPHSTRDNLPFEDFPRHYRSVVLNACREAWRLLLLDATTRGVDTSKANEDDLTASLKEILNDLLADKREPARGFTLGVFQPVRREASVMTYDGSSLDKKPDLVFQLIDTQPGRRLPEYRGLFTECKIVSASRPARLYCTEGVKRFVDGEYAWAMPSALMLGYARNGAVPGDSLVTALTRLQSKSHDPVATVDLPAPDDQPGSEPKALVSTHLRKWCYRNGAEPGSIRLSHLWLEL